jgi:hypothetical protein
MSVTSGTVVSMDVAQPESQAVPTTDDERDIALCKEIKALGETGVPHAVFMASLGAA